MANIHVRSQKGIAAVEELLAARAAKKIADEREKSAKDAVRSLFKNPGDTLVIGGRVAATLSEKSRTSLDSAKVRLLAPATYKKCVSVTTYTQIDVPRTGK